MKNMRKIASVLLALVMVFALAAPVFAAETYSITINNSAEGYTYVAYQIFKGELSNAADNDAAEGTDAVLSNIQWGSSVGNAADLGDAATVAEGLTNDTLAALLDQVALTSVKATSKYEDGKYVISGLEPGYYLVQNTKVAADGSYTEYIVEVVENSTVTPKSDVPEFEKKVMDTNDSTGVTSDWQDSADYDIGDNVPFMLKATLADNVTAYEEYKVIFHDKLSEGLTFNPESVEVFVGDTKVTTGYVLKTEETCSETCTFEVVIDDVAKVGATNSSVITVYYTARLNEGAEVGYMGNPNYAHLEYSNNPNWSADGQPGTPGTPGTPGDETPEEPTGKTPEDKVIVFTYKFVVDKVDQDKQPLEGAGFTLYKWEIVTPATEDTDAVYDWVAKGNELKGEALTTFAWTGLDDGSYKLVETTTPAGYNTISPIEFTIEANHDTTWEAEDRTEILISLTGNKYTGDVESGAYETEVENKSGVELPETGGMGTTLFYAFGAIMVLGAAVLLVTKKRMSIAE